MFNEETLPGFFYLVDPVPPTFSPPIPNQIVKKEKRKVSFFLSLFRVLTRIGILQFSFGDEPLVVAAHFDEFILHGWY